MPEVTLDLIKTLREKTNAGMMNCKAALTEAEGDLEAAETVLRKKGLTAADKKAGRATKEGAISARIAEGENSGCLLEVSCETDFVAKNDNFRTFLDQLLDHAEAAEDFSNAEELLAQKLPDGSTTADELVKLKVGELGENMALSRAVRYTVEGTGVVASYIHMQGKVGVLVEVGCETDAVTSDDIFCDLVKDITLHIAAASPLCISRDEIPADQIATEREIYADQVKDKPENIIDKIVDGKLEKFYGTMALLEQGFIKDSDQSVGELIAAKGKELGETLELRRFTRYAIGEEG
jgi:elongation factor Ts